MPSHRFAAVAYCNRVIAQSLRASHPNHPKLYLCYHVPVLPPPPPRSPSLLLAKRSWCSAGACRCFAPRLRDAPEGHRIASGPGCSPTCLLTFADRHAMQQRGLGLPPRTTSAHRRPGSCFDGAQADSQVAIVELQKHVDAQPPAGSPESSHWSHVAARYGEVPVAPPLPSQRFPTFCRCFFHFF